MNPSSAVAFLLEREQSAESGWVYIMQSGDESPLKVGWAKEPRARLATLQTGNPHELRILCVVPGTVKAEQFLHRRLRRERVRGEWFDGEKTRALLAEMREQAVEVAEMFRATGSISSALPEPHRFRGRDYDPPELRKVDPNPALSPDEANHVRRYAQGLSQRELDRFLDAVRERDPAEPMPLPSAIAP